MARRRTVPRTHRGRTSRPPETRPASASSASCSVSAWTCLLTPARAGASCTLSTSAASTARGAAGGCSSMRSTPPKSPSPRCSNTAPLTATLPTASRRPSRFWTTSATPACAGDVPERTPERQPTYQSYDLMIDPAATGGTVKTPVRRPAPSPRAGGSCNPPAHPAADTTRRRLQQPTEHIRAPGSPNRRPARQRARPAPGPFSDLVQLKRRVAARYAAHSSISRRRRSNRSERA